MIDVKIKVEIGDRFVEIETVVSVPSQAKELVIATIAALVAESPTPPEATG